MKASMSRILPLICILAACSSGTSIDATVRGTWSNVPLDVSFESDSGGFGGVTDGTLGNSDAVRDIAPGLAMLGSIPAYSSASGSVGPAEPAQVEVVFDTPPPLVYAGPWTVPNATFTFQDANEERLLTIGVQNALVLDFDEPDFSSFGEVTMVQTGRVSGTATKAGDVTFDGSFQLQYECHEQSTYYRHCGNGRAEDGKANPVNRPYTEDTCPRELVAPYEASPKWDGDTLHLGDLEVDCRKTRAANLLCYDRRTGVEADGCEWTVHFLTDGAVQQFAVAAFAGGSCAKKFCNTYR